MKKFIQKIVFTRRTLLGVIVLAAFAGALWWYEHYSLRQFIISYDAYHTFAVVQQNAAFVPGTTNNPLRERLNQTLAEVLTKEISPKDRLKRAHQGLDYIIQSNQQIDAIGESALDVRHAIDRVEYVAQTPGNILYRQAMLTLVSQAKQELYTVEDIRGLSYRANFETAEIFNRIITANGVLTDAYIKELNGDIPGAETSFNKRQDSYADLQKQMSDIDREYTKLTGS